jgi:NAD(P)-dependent dehydrogenase (short-subunit alcohol dehydrogenase family)
MTRAAVPLLRRAAGSVIVNIASVLGIRPLRDVSVYSATKAGVIQLTRSAAIELARDQIRVNALAPGYVRTDINTEVLDGPAGDALKKKTPLRRFAVPDELNAPFLLLLDPRNSYMTGSTLVVDGGMSAGL